ncbi:MAG: transcriptional repressor [Clostridia bacterium]|nr:transcriptional repressor [Clostridia bacterium]
MRQTIQKKQVLNAVLNSSDHPDVETIYNRVKTTLPNISLATVYRVLTSLSKQGKILKVDCLGGDRYDKTLCVHAHLKCESCGKVVDVHSVNVDNLLKTATQTENMHINGVGVMFTGLCENCNGN